MKTISFKLLLFFLLLSNVYSYSQTDTLISLDNNILVGEIKKLEKGVVTMKTDYSDSDFKIEWLKVKKINTTKSFRIVFSNGGRYFGTIHMDTVTNKVLIIDEEKGNQLINIVDLVYFEEIKRGSLLDVLKLSMDFGYSFTSTTELHQLNGDINANYNKKRWGFSTFYSTVQNTQKDATPTVRNNGGFGVKYFLHYGLFGALNADYYSNNEQDMALRSNYSGGFGKFIVRTNQIYFNGFIGIAYTLENYKDTLPNRESFEGKIGMEFNMFDLGDLNLFANVMMYPSFTEKSRLRTLIKTNLKYDLPKDFYIKTGIDYNYDTKPIEGVDPEDYVFTIGIGWEL